MRRSFLADVAACCFSLLCSEPSCIENSDPQVLQLSGSCPIAELELSTLNPDLRAHDYACCFGLNLRRLLRSALLCATLHDRSVRLCIWQ